MKKKFNLLLIVFVTLFISSCSVQYFSKTSFPAPDDVFITSGDGDIQKPYTPVGQLIYFKTGFRIPFFLLGLIPIADVDPDKELKTEVFTKIREMGGDALINMSISWQPPKSGFLGFGASGGMITVYGTVIKR